METLIKTIPINKAKTLQQFKDAIGDQILIINPSFDWYSELDARKRSCGNWPKYYFVKVINNEIRLETTVTSELKWFSDCLCTMRPHYSSLRTGTFPKPDPEETFFKFWQYCLKKKVSYKLSTSVLPEQLTERLIAKYTGLKTILNDATKLINGMDNVTDKYKKNWKRIPENVIQYRYGRYTGIVYKCKKKSYEVELNYQELPKFLESGSGGWSWLEASGYYNTTNRDYKIVKPSSKASVTKLHTMLEDYIKGMTELYLEIRNAGRNIFNN